MKRIWMFLVFTALVLSACGSGGHSSGTEVLRPEAPSSASEESAAQAEPKQESICQTESTGSTESTQEITVPTQTSQPAEPVETTWETQAPSSEPNFPPEGGFVIDTSYYTITLPDSWREDCIYSITESTGYGYSVKFEDRTSHEAIGSGELFVLHLFTWFEDYSIYPVYQVLGSLDVYRIGLYNIVVTYPSDVRFTDDTAEQYNRMFSEIPGILETISYKDECVFSEVPSYPPDLLESLAWSFYGELQSYVLSSCVNDTEWWDEPSLSVTDPTYYYLGCVTPDNYTELMTQAKSLVDEIYKASYWENRYNGYGVLKIGLYMKQEYDTYDLYLCYR